MEQHNTDIQTAAQLALAHYRNMLDPKKHHIPYFFVTLAEDESCAFHSEWDFGDASGRYLDSLILCRQMTGDESSRDAEEKLKDALRWMFSRGDGLSYRMESNAWVKAGANMFDQRSVLMGLTTWYLENGDEEAYRLIQGMVKGLLKIGVAQDDFICFPFNVMEAPPLAPIYVPGMEIPDPIFTEKGFVIDPIHHGGGVTILPLAILYEKTKDEDTLRLLRGLVNFVVYHSEIFAEDGSFWSKNRFPDGCDGHFHSRMSSVAGIIRYAIAVNDISLLEWADRVYQWARSMGGSTGWFPEGIGTQPEGQQFHYARHSETCSTTDMIHCALYLSKCGFRNYWDHAEQYLNQLLFSQITDVSWAKTVTDKEDTDSHSYRDLPNRYRGAFTGRTRPNDLTLDGKISTMACCCAAGGRGMYLLWQSATEKQDSTVTINHFLSKETPELAMFSALPDSGAVEFKIKQNIQLRIRIPNWMDVAAMQLQQNGVTMQTAIKSGYLEIPQLAVSDTVTLQFPLPERKSDEQIGENTYTITWKGNRVVDIEPAGQYMPFCRK